MERRIDDVLVVQPATSEREEYVDQVLAEMIAKSRVRTVQRESGEEEDGYELGSMYRQIVTKLK